jgi:hypothetical protein
LTIPKSIPKLSTGPACSKTPPEDPSPKLSLAALVHAALPAIVSVGVAAAKNPKAVGPIEARQPSELRV